MVSAAQWLPPATPTSRHWVGKGGAKSEGCELRPPKASGMSKQMAQTSLKNVGLRPPHTETLNAVHSHPAFPLGPPPVLFQEKTKGVPAAPPPCGPSSKKTHFLSPRWRPEGHSYPELPQPPVSALATSGGAPRSSSQAQSGLQLGAYILPAWN